MAAAAALALTVSVAGTAFADHHDPIPTQSQVDAAKARADHDAHSVAAIRASLATANTRLENASNAAEVASENYNGAVWKLSVAKQQLTKATSQADAAEARVVEERRGIGALVAQSSQEGFELNSVSALMTAEGPQGVMNRYGAFQSANDSLHARYEEYKNLNVRAKVFQAKAATAREQSQQLADQAKKLRDSAAAAAASAQSEAASIASQKSTLIHELAKAQNVSVAIARQRQSGLEELARQRAEAAARAKAKAEAAAAARNAKDHPNTDSPPPPPTGTPPPPSGSAVARVIAFAKAQLGEAYVWAAAGPNTWDCSGLTMMAWREGGIYLPHYSVAQYDVGTPISIASAQPGDLLFWSNNGRPSGIHHVALYLGGGAFIEAPHTGADVRYNTISAEYPNFAVRL
ncbi:MAG: NlpC/P60 family protein [Marmoricola sp.]|jgi:cell wall-associated NlpC family hydrolase|nr:NlpC/P60 family protein [Marmoricola sp.]